MPEAQLFVNRDPSRDVVRATRELGRGDPRGPPRCAGGRHAPPASAPPEQSADKALRSSHCPDRGGGRRGTRRGTAGTELGESRRPYMRRRAENLRFHAATATLHTPNVRSSDLGTKSSGG
jgi:hypothetical protein